MVSTLVSIYFGRPLIRHRHRNISDYWSKDILTVDFFMKGSRTSFLTIFCVWFFKKNIPPVIFYYLIKFHCLVVFLSWDISQYVYSNYLLSSLWHHKFWNEAVFVQLFFCITKKSGHKCKYLKNKKSCSHELKSIFHHF